MWRFAYIAIVKVGGVSTSCDFANKNLEFKFCSGASAVIWQQHRLLEPRTRCGEQKVGVCLRLVSDARCQLGADPDSSDVIEPNAQDL